VYVYVRKKGKVGWMMASIMPGHAFHFNPFSVNSEMQLQN